MDANSALTSTSRSTSRWVILVIFFLLLLALGVGVLFRFFDPWLKARVLDLLRKKFHANVELRDFQVSAFPSLSVHGSGLALRYEGKTDVPPLIAIAEFSASGSFLDAIKKPWKIQRVQLKGLQINIAPGLRKSRDWSKVRDIPVLVKELVSDDAKLNIYSRNPEKPPRVFLIHHLDMHSIGLDRAASFTADLTNPTPPGEIKTTGHFGPWNSDDPSQTALNADFTFDDADLGVFRGISGILSSTGKFGGVLEQIETQGETRTPEFAVATGGHRVLLTTQYNATVDGTNGNTLLHPVRAQFLHSSLIANGGVIGTPGVKGRTVSLDVVAENGRLEDYLRLVVKSDEPLMTGALSFRTKFELPPGPKEIIERLRLAGRFGVQGAQFTDPKIAGKLETLSRKGQGKPADEEVGSAVSDLQGKFVLNDGKITFTDLTFSVLGATVLLNGSYGLKDENLDFHGRLRLQAKISQTMTGYKSFLLKPFDPFFRKNNATELPIKITGSRTKPSFGLDFGHKH